jgi:hypothetical protein
VTDFKDSYASWRRKPFPQGSSTDSLDELHADLALADTWVAETVIPFVERGVYKPAQVDVIQELGKLHDRAREIEQMTDGEDRRLAADYGHHAALLVGVYNGFLAQAPSSS